MSSNPIDGKRLWISLLILALFGSALMAMAVNREWVWVFWMTWLTLVASSIALFSFQRPRLALVGLGVALAAGWALMPVY